MTSGCVSISPCIDMISVYVFVSYPILSCTVFYGCFPFLRFISSDPTTDGCLFLNYR